jgi:hypothetical protein
LGVQVLQAVAEIVRADLLVAELVAVVGAGKVVEVVAGRIVEEVVGQTVVAEGEVFEVELRTKRFARWRRNPLGH